MLFHVTESERSTSDRKNASIKPRRDVVRTVERVFSSRELKCEFDHLRQNANLIDKIIYQFSTYSIWNRGISKLP